MLFPRGQQSLKFSCQGFELIQTLTRISLDLISFVLFKSVFVLIWVSNAVWEVSFRRYYEHRTHNCQHMIGLQHFHFVFSIG